MLLLPTMLMTADLGVLWLATPRMVADLRPSSSELLWITDIYGFMTAGFLITLGTLGDRIGRRKLLMAGSVLFIGASLISAYAVSAPMLIVGRALLGIAGAAVLPSTLSLITHMFENPKQRGTAIAMWVTALSIGLGIGPVIGGLLITHLWWGSVFLIGIPVMVLALVGAPLLLPEYRDPGAGRLDLLSVALFLLGILPIIYAVDQFAQDGPSLLVLVIALVGIAFAVTFVRRQRVLAEPMIDLRLFRNRGFTMAQVVLIFGMMALNGVEYLIPQFLQLVGNTSPLATALWLVPGAAGLLLGSQLTPIITNTVRPAYVIAGGQVIALVGYALIYLAGSGSSGVVLAAVGLTIIMLGVAPISVLATGIAVGSAPPEKAGVAAGTGQTSYDLGLAFGIAVTGSAAVAVYRADVAGTLPAGVPAAAGGAVRDTLGGAVSAAQTLPKPLADQVVTVARDAFNNGLHTAAIISAVLAAALAVAVSWMLRGAPATAAATPEDAGSPAAVGVEIVVQSE
jgi:DHA2 family multidrug resistance protein-like MFS transporter